MNIALPILLLVFGGLTFWVLVESSLRWYLKAACISAFCIFTIVFWSSIHSFLGWPALESSMPEKMAVHWVIIKEPNKLVKFPGRIYILSESLKEDSSALARFFGYRQDKIEPRLHGVEYSRELHEQLEKQVIPRLKNGQVVAGKFMKKSKRQGVSVMGGEGEEGKGGGSESQKQEWHFHELLPSEIHKKNGS